MSPRNLVAASLLLTLGTAALASGGSPDPFKTEVDCTGIHAPGDRVPYTIEVEDRVGQSHDVQYTFEIVLPGGGTVPLTSGAYTIQANQQSFIRRALTIPAGAVSGRYSLRIESASPTWTFTDTCSFHVQ